MMPPPALSAQESASLLATLRPHLEVEDLQLLAIDAAHWCIGCPAPQDLVCTDPALAVGRDIHPLLPAGKDAARWRRLGTELQMLLHEHPVNKAREARGFGVAACDRQYRVRMRGSPRPSPCPARWPGCPAPRSYRWAQTWHARLTPTHAGT
jgi:hypothetical protein